MIEEKIEFDIDGITLRGKLNKPDSVQKKYPLFLMLHGLTGYMDEKHVEKVAYSAVEAGYISLRVDQYGHGTSDGEFKDHNVLIWMKEAIQLVDIISNWDFVSYIVLCGHSQGGLNSILVAGHRPDKIKALIPLSAAVNIVYGARTGQFLGKQVDMSSASEMIEFEGHPLLSNYLKVAASLPLEEMIDNYKGPVLLIHGTGDTTVPCDYSKKLHEQYFNSKLILFENDEHCYDIHLNEVADTVKNYLIELSKNNPSC